MRNQFQTLRGRFADKTVHWQGDKISTVSTSVSQMTVSELSCQWTGCQRTGLSVQNVQLPTTQDRISSVCCLVAQTIKHWLVSSDKWLCCRRQTTNRIVESSLLTMTRLANGLLHWSPVCTGFKGRGDESTREINRYGSTDVCSKVTPVKLSTSWSREF